MLRNRAKATIPDRKTGKKLLRRNKKIFLLGTLILLFIVCLSCLLMYFARGDEFSRSLSDDIMASNTESVHVMGREVLAHPRDSRMYMAKVSDSVEAAAETEEIGASHDDGSDDSSVNCKVSDNNSSPSDNDSDGKKADTESKKKNETESNAETGSYADVIKKILAETGIPVKENNNTELESGDGGYGSSLDTLGIGELPLMNEKALVALPVYLPDNAKYQRDDYIAAMSVLPAAMLRKLSSLGWTLHVSDRDICEVFPIVDLLKDIDDVGGVCFFPIKEIWLSVDADPLLAVHEIGHAIDWESGGPSIRQEWQEAVAFAETTVKKSQQNIAAYGSTAFTDIPIYPICEEISARGRFFEQYATAFDAFWRSPGQLIQECPELYLYFAEQFGAGDMLQEHISALVPLGQANRVRTSFYDINDKKPSWADISFTCKKKNHKQQSIYTKIIQKALDALQNRNE